MKLSLIHSRWLALWLGLALLLSACLPCSFPPAMAETAEEDSPWRTAEEAEAARAAAEEKAREIGQRYRKLNEAADEAEEEAEYAMEEAEELIAALKAARAVAEKADQELQAQAQQEVESLSAQLKEVRETVREMSQEAENARRQAEALFPELEEAAMVLKAATEAAVQIARIEAISDDKISAVFHLGERYSGSFNEEMAPVYLRFHLNQHFNVRVKTSGATISLSILNGTGNTILTLIPTSSGNGSVCSLDAGEYTVMVSPLGTGRQFTVSIDEDHSDPTATPSPALSPSMDGDTEMTVLID